MKERTGKRILVYIALLVAMVWLKSAWNKGRGPSAPEQGDANRSEQLSGVVKNGASEISSSGSVSSTKVTAAEAADRATVKLAEQILATKNDNDHRLDTDFNHLSPGAKRLLEERYAKYPLESRNERGTLVFLLGRNMTTPEDFAFLHSVLSEPACLSLSNCSKDEGGSTSSESLHLEGGAGVTLAYPQLVALKQTESYLFGSKASPIRLADAMANLEAARRSPVSRVAQLADEIFQRYQRRRH